MRHDRQTPKQHARAALRRSILLMEMAPGAPVDEAAQCAEFGISRTPLREVLQALAGEGFVTLHENRGARVSEMSHRELRDFFLAAPMVYGAILRLAAENAQAAQIADLKAAQTAFRAALEGGDAAARTLANDRFHRITGDMAGNTYLTPSFHRLLIDHARIGMTFFRRRHARQAPNGAPAQREAADQHDAMIAAIETGDPEAAAALAGAHWSLSRGQIESFVMPSGLDATLDATLGALPGPKGGTP